MVTTPTPFTSSEITGFLTYLALQEMFLQGDRERSLGQTVSPLMDRTKAGITKSQCGFFTVVAQPMFKVRGRTGGTSVGVEQGAAWPVQPT